MTSTSETTMKAACYQSYGGPEQLSIRQIAIPSAARHEILIRIHASTVNRTDCGFLRGKPYIVRFFSGLRKPRATVLGCEFAGEVVALGDDATGFAIGDRVVGFKDDDFGFGGHAEYTAMPADAMVARIPDHLSYLESAGALEGAHYALHYIRAAGIHAGSSVLINGATGAIGSAALQIIKHIGCRVVAVCATTHLDTIKNLGADRVIDYTSEDFTECGETFDFVFDAVGKSDFFKCRKLMIEEGCYASTELGPYWQNPFLGLWSKWFGQRKVLFPIPVNRKADAEYLCDLLQKKHYLPMVDSTYELDDIAAAYRYVETGMKAGTVVITL